MFLKFVCLFALVSFASAIVCLPGMCDPDSCTTLTAENCKGTIKQGGGFCGCCDSCMTELAVGEKCMSIYFMGIPPTVQCATGSRCDPSTHMCTSTTTDKRATGTCLEKLAAVDQQLKASNGMLLGLERPHCADDGSYAGMQFAGSQAFCVTKDGTSIPSYSVNRWETGTDMNCQCARDLHAYMETGLIGKLFRCDPNGNYARTQCMGDVCYCVDPTGNMVGTSKVQITQLGSLNC